MPKVICDWDACKHNVESFCKCLGAISLRQSIGLKKEYLDCENFRYPGNTETEIEADDDEN